MKTDLAKLRELEKSLWRAPWCPEYLWGAIRHVQRNCEIECIAHGEDIDACEGPARYDGRALGELRNALPALLDELEQLRAAVASWETLADHGIDTPEAVLEMCEFANDQRKRRQELTVKLAAVEKVEKELRADDDDPPRGTPYFDGCADGAAGAYKHAADLLAAALKKGEDNG